MKKKTIAASLMSIALCGSLVTGATFALFTSEDGVNIAINAGKVEVVAEVTDLALYSQENINVNTLVGTKIDVVGDTFPNGGTATYADGTLTLDRLTPGDGVTFNVSVTNNSNVAIKYRTVISDPNGSELIDALEVTIRGVEYSGATVESWTYLEAEGAIAAIPVSIELPTSANDDYQGLSVSLSISIEAMQGNAVDPVDKWDGTVGEVPEDNVIETAAEFAAFVASVNEGNTYADETVKLASGIDLAGQSWTPIKNFAGTLDGQGYTVSNLSANLFETVSGTVKNLNVENVNVVNPTRGGANGFIGTVEAGGLIDNCNVSDVTITWADGIAPNRNGEIDISDCWGGMISRINAGATVQNSEFKNIKVQSYGKMKRTGGVFAEVGGTISGCTIDGVTLIATDNHSGLGYLTQAGGIIADLYTGSLVSDCIINNVTVLADEAFNTGGIIGKAYVTGTAGPCEITLKNITVNGLAMTAGNTDVTYATVKNVGGFIGQMDSRNNDSHLTVDNCHINGLDMTVASIKKGEDPSAGFIASLNGGADITNCSVVGKIDGTNESIGIGGFLGCVGGYGANNDYTIDITDCSANVAITGNENIFVGGFVAYAGSYNQTMTKSLALNFTNCEAAGSFYGKVETGTNEISFFTGCKVDGVAFDA